MKGERRGKKKTKFSVLTVPNRLFSSEKIVKGERRGKQKTKFSVLTMPNRLFSSEKTKNSPRPVGKGIWGGRVEVKQSRVAPLTEGIDENRHAHFEDDTMQNGNGNELLAP